jgi:hypothetical protein
VVLDEFSYGVPKMSLAEQHQFVQALALDRQHGPLGVGIQVRTVRWQLDVFDARAAEYVAESTGEERIAIVDDVAHPAQEAVDPVGEAARLCWPICSSAPTPTEARDRIRQHGLVWLRSQD